MDIKIEQQQQQQQQQQQVELGPCSPSEVPNDPGKPACLLLLLLLLVAGWDAPLQLSFVSLVNPYPQNRFRLPSARNGSWMQSKAIVFHS
ncbi:hypothetical protein KR009_004063 [Drosophila setifemur]|nr:hypothetical protein KR009_004063 [Drosophila setifemur]